MDKTYFRSLTNREAFRETAFILRGILALVLGAIMWFMAYLSPPIAPIEWGVVLTTVELETLIKFFPILIGLGTALCIFLISSVDFFIRKRSYVYCLECGGVRHKTMVEFEERNARKKRCCACYHEINP